MATAVNPASWLTEEKKFVNILGLITTGICVSIRANQVGDFLVFLVVISSEAPENSPPEQSGVNLMKAGVQQSEPFITIRNETSVCLW